MGTEFNQVTIARRCTRHYPNRLIVVDSDGHVTAVLPNAGQTSGDWCEQPQWVAVAVAISRGDAEATGLFDDVVVG